MLDYDTLFDDLGKVGPGGWRDQLESLLHERTADGAHGNLKDWRNVLQQLRTAGDRERIRELLMQLVPWRKGPFSVRGITIDAEWRSDLKWDRIKDEIMPPTGRTILDVGCGNGYYALRMLDAGARVIIGIDPTLLYVCQFLAIARLTRVRNVHVLPLRLNEWPTESHTFDTTFSMGVLYHQREPREHLQQLLGTLRPGGELVLETLILPGAGRDVRQPEERYARMRNVWHLPTAATLEEWIADTGFRDIRLVNVSTTTPDEQRSTEWMPFESLAEALDSEDPTLTVEGWPAPTRAVVVCNAP